MLDQCWLNGGRLFNTEDQHCINISSTLDITQNTRRRTNVNLMLAHRLRRWANIKSALAQRLVLIAGYVPVRAVDVGGDIRGYGPALLHAVYTGVHRIQWLVQVNRIRPNEYINIRLILPNVIQLSYTNIVFI